jgi:hypothetical protein
LDRDAPRCRVVSFLPDQGRVSVIIKEPGTYHIRIPGFAPREGVKSWRNGEKEKTSDWNGDYIEFASAKAGDVLTVTYPLVTFTQKMKRGGTDYTIRWQGNAVTSLAPQGKIWPLFESASFSTPPYPR